MEAIEYLINKWNLCLPLIYDEDENIVEEFVIHMIYDPYILRQKKLNTLSNEKNEIYFKETKDTQMLFELDLLNEYVYVHTDIWEELQDIYLLSNDNIMTLINDLLYDKIIEYEDNTYYLNRFIPTSAPNMSIFGNLKTLYKY